MLSTWSPVVALFGAVMAPLGGGIAGGDTSLEKNFEDVQFLGFIIFEDLCCHFMFSLCFLFVGRKRDQLVSHCYAVPTRMESMPLEL